MQDTPPTPAKPELTENGETAPTVESGQAGQVDTLPSPEELLRQAELKAAEHHDAWLRAKAETENLRRRAQEDIAPIETGTAPEFSLEDADLDPLNPAAAPRKVPADHHCKPTKAGVG